MDRRNRPGQSDSENGNRPGQSDSEKGNGYNSAGVGGGQGGFLFFFYRPKLPRTYYGFQDMVFGTWDLNFGAWEILGYGFQDMVFKTWFSRLGISTLGPGFSHSRFPRPKLENF
jgi:hypothetical protein